ncbi:MAG: hypothetical protein Q8N77_04575 [Nanoarchaeota archaeon]|nr:hypothetical protein [Nanoarchaeota archaeon]
MKNKIVLLPFFAVLVFILSLGAVSAIDISVDNYYPAPVEAGEYLNVWLKITNPGADRPEYEAKNAVVKLKPSFPFSLDPGEPEEIVISSIKGGSFVIKKFKIRVDGGAAEGENKLAFQYADFKDAPWKEKSIPITVIESQTTFDVVLQELNEEGVFIAIANIGKNPANAVTVRIPEQEHFRTQTVSASIVGNLASGDYTLVGFSILPKTDNAQVGASETTTQEEGQQRRQQTLSGEPENLLVQIDYTDPLGSRRTIAKEIPLNPSSLTLMSAGTSGTGTTFARTGTAQNSTLSTLLSNTWFWVSIALIVLMIGSKVYRRIKKRKD